MTGFNKGDLIYSEKFDEYAIFIEKSTWWTGWLLVYLPSTGERKQVHDHIWELA